MLNAIQTMVIKVVFPRGDYRALMETIMLRDLENQDGGVAVVFALVAFVLVLLGGAALDLGRLSSQATHFQQTADAASLNAVRLATETSLTDQEIKTRAIDFALAHLRPDNELEPRVEVAIDRTASPTATVTISRDVDLVFGAFVGRQHSLVRRKATAVSDGRQPLCLLVLNPVAPASWSMQGTPDLVAPDCVVQVNSTAANAVATGGNARAVTQETRVSAKSVTGAPNISPLPKAAQQPVEDPYKSIKWPGLAPCDRSDGQVKKTKRTLTPGVYCGGIGAETHGELDLEPGLYVIQSGSLSLSSGGRIRAPGGVTIILTDPLGTVDIGSQGYLEIEAPTSGDWKGIAVAVKPQPLRLTSNMQGGAEMNLSGVVYMPTQTLHLTGGGEMGADLSARMFVVDSIRMNGNGQIRLKGDPALLSVVGGSARLVN